MLVQASLAASIRREDRASIRARASAPLAVAIRAKTVRAARSLAMVTK